MCASCSSSSQFIKQMKKLRRKGSVKRYMTQIENSLTAPCWHHIWRESKALWINMAALCAKRPQSQKQCFSTGLAIFWWLQTDKMKTWNFKLEKTKITNGIPCFYYHCFGLNTDFSNSFFVSPPTGPQWIVAEERFRQHRNWTQSVLIEINICFHKH